MRRLFVTALLIVPFALSQEVRLLQGCDDEQTGTNCTLAPSMISTTASPTMSPTMAPSIDTVDECSTLVPGDVMVVALSSDNPDVVALVALEALPKSLTLYLTNNAWDGTAFVETEDTIRLTIPSEMRKGTVFGYDSANDSQLLYGMEWQSVRSTTDTTSAGSLLSLSNEGDNVHIYCYTNDGVIHHLGAYSYNGDWLEPGLNPEAYGSALSALPEPLSELGETTLFHFDNYAYQGPVIGGKDDIQVHLTRQSFWNGYNNGDAMPLDVPSRFYLDGEMPDDDSLAATRLPSAVWLLSTLSSLLLLSCNIFSH